MMEKETTESSEEIPLLGEEQIAEKFPESQKTEISAEQKLYGHIFYPMHVPGRRPAILYIHGWKSNEGSSLELASHRAEEGDVCLTINLRGHGRSTGKRDESTREDFMRDVVAAYEFLEKNPKVDPENITIVGTSFGGYLGSILATTKNAKRLILRAPANYPDEGFGDKTELPTSDMPEIMNWRNTKVDWTGSKSLDALHSFRGDLLVVESGQDEQVPHQTVLNYIDAVQSKDHVTHRVIENTSHRLTDEAKIKFREIIDTWLADRYKKEGIE